MVYPTRVRAVFAGTRSQQPLDTCMRLVSVKSFPEMMAWGLLSRSWGWPEFERAAFLLYLEIRVSVLRPT